MDVIFQLLASSFGAAFVGGLFMLIQKRMERKTEERGQSNRLTEATTKELIESVKTMKDSNLVILRDRVKYLARNYIAKGAVKFDEREDLLTLYAIYSERLGGNGNIEDLMKAFREIPLSD